MNTTKPPTLLPPGKHPEPQSAAVFGPPPCEAIWPRDSIIEDYMGLARQFCEAEDQILVGAFPPVAAGALGRNIYINFGQRIFPNLYHVIVAKPGLPTAIDLVTHIARSLLPEEALFSGVTSVQSLFLEYLTHPDKLWLVGEDVLNNWACDVAGKGVARQLLTLYDCPPWRESYLKHKKGDGEAIHEVAQTSTSILLGAMPSSARFSALETRDGMRQRFSYYTSERFGRLISWPPAYDNSRELVEFTRTLEALRDLKGEMRLSVEARELWKQLQVENRRQIEEVSGIDSVSEIHASVLAASPMKILKLGMLFQICRWFKDKTRDWQVITADTLKIAAQHQSYCIQANKALDGTVNRAEIQDEADAIDTLNRELDALRQRRHQHCEPDPGYCAAES